MPGLLQQLLCGFVYVYVCVRVCVYTPETINSCSHEIKPSLIS